MAAVTTVTHNEKVKILFACVKRSTNELLIRIDRPWEELSEGLRDQLFKKAKWIARKKRGLQPGWTFNFYYKQ